MWSVIITNVWGRKDEWSTGNFLQRMMSRENRNWTELFSCSLRVLMRQNRTEDRDSLRSDPGGPNTNTQQLLAVLLLLYIPDVRTDQDQETKQTNNCKQEALRHRAPAAREVTPVSCLWGWSCRNISIFVLLS